MMPMMGRGCGAVEDELFGVSYEADMGQTGA
jgi:hypothetical protein